MKETLKTVLIIIAIAVIIIVVGTIIIKNIVNVKVGKDVQQSSQDTVVEATPQMDNVAINTFNAMFKSYEGTKNGTQVMSLLQKVNNSNQSNKDHKITVTGVNNTASIDTQSNYNISISYDSNGYINIITISTM